MTPKQMEIAKRPFTPSEIEWISKSERDKPKAYVSAPAIIVRLWEIFPDGWEWREEIVQISTSFVLVKGAIVVQEVVEGVLVVHEWSGHGSGSIHKGSDEGDAAKGGGSYALRKSASRLRIGEHLWLDPPRWNGEHVKGQGGKNWNDQRRSRSGGPGPSSTPSQPPQDRRSDHAQSHGAPRPGGRHEGKSPKSALIGWAKDGPGSYPELDQHVRAALGIAGGSQVPKIKDLTDEQARRVLASVRQAAPAAAPAGAVQELLDWARRDLGMSEAEVRGAFKSKPEGWTPAQFAQARRRLETIAQRLDQDARDHRDDRTDTRGT
jgi:hypothetical protein